MAVLVVWMFLVTAALVRLGLVVGQFRREIVRKLGDIMAFLDQLEADVIAELLERGDCIVSLGGGALANDSTRALVTKATCVWLETGLAQAVDRVGMNRNRPLLLGNVRGQLADLMAAREPLYREVARYTVNTSALDVSGVVAAIQEQLGDEA